MRGSKNMTNALSESGEPRLTKRSGEVVRGADPSSAGAWRRAAARSAGLHELFAADHAHRAPARQLRTVRMPLFPSYVFVRLDLERDRWRSVNGTYGVARLVMADGRPVPVPKGVVKSLLDLRDANGVVRLDHNLSIGQEG